MSSVFVASIPAAPANREVVGRAPALVTQFRQPDQRNAPYLDLDKCRNSEAHELTAQGPIRTERIKYACAINARVRFQSLPLPRYLPRTSSVLISRRNRLSAPSGTGPRIARWNAEWSMLIPILRPRAHP